MTERAKCGLPGGKYSVVVSAAQVVTAMSADQLAAVAGQAVAACGTNLAMMIKRQVIDGACRTTL